MTTPVRTFWLVSPEDLKKLFVGNSEAVPGKFQDFIGVLFLEKSWEVVAFEIFQC